MPLKVFSVRFLLENPLLSSLCDIVRTTFELQELEDGLQLVSRSLLLTLEHRRDAPVENS